MAEQKIIEYKKKEDFSVRVESYTFTYDRKFVSFTGPRERQDFYYLTVIGREHGTPQQERKCWLNFHNDTSSAGYGYGSISEVQISKTEMEINFHVDDKIFNEIINTLRNEQEVNIDFSAGLQKDSTIEDYMIYYLRILSSANKV